MSVILNEEEEQESSKMQWKYNDNYTVVSLTSRSPLCSLKQITNMEIGPNSEGPLCSIQSTTSNWIILRQLYKQHFTISLLQCPLLHVHKKIDVDFIKLEPKEEYVAQHDAEMTKEEIDEENHGSSPYRQVHRVILMRQTSHDLAIVSDLYSLMEDFMTMARSSKSLLCCQPAGCPSLLICQLCGEHFIGKFDRMHKLCKHYESAHPFDALNLTLDGMKRYNKLIEHMRNALEFDEWFGNINYAVAKGTKSFHCFNCKDCC